MHTCLAVGLWEVRSSARCSQWPLRYVQVRPVPLCSLAPHAAPQTAAASSGPLSPPAPGCLAVVRGSCWLAVGLWEVRSSARCSQWPVAPQVRAAPLLARSARGAADGGRVVRPVAVARSVGPIVCCCWMGDRRQPPVGGRSCQCVLSAADGAQVRRRPSWSVAAVPAALPRHCRRRTALPVTVAVRMASRAVGAVETVGEAAVVGRALANPPWRAVPAAASLPQRAVQGA